MKTFTSEEISLIKNILQNADDRTLYELFGTVYETVKAIIKKQAERDKEPYQFFNRFSDLN